MAFLFAKKKTKHIEGVSEELNSIASQNLDFAPARRRARSAFIEVQQQLDHPLFKLAPSGIRTEEWYVKNSKDLEIFCKSWLPKDDVRMKGFVFSCPGYADTCTFFFEGIAKRIAASGYAIYAIDHPGFGLSEGLHGYISCFDELVDNVIECYMKMKGRPEASGLPRFLFGESMAGAVAIKAHLKQPNEWDGLLLICPMWKAPDEVLPAPAIIKILMLLSKFLPEAKLIPKIDIPEYRDTSKLKLVGYNVIHYNDRMRLRTGMQLLKATKDIEINMEKVSCPLLILHGDADMVSDPLMSKLLYEKASSKDKTFKLYPGCFHSILEGEPDDKISTALEDINSWLDSHCELE